MARPNIPHKEAAGSTKEADQLEFLEVELDSISSRNYSTGGPGGVVIGKIPVKNTETGAVIGYLPVWS